MASRSWNRVELIGNLTRDPELRYTPSGAAVCTFGLATNHTYTTSDGEKKEDVDFHRLVSWNKLAEICNQFLKKGTKVFVSGRLKYREWEPQEGQKRREAEIVMEDMIILTPKPSGEVLQEESQPEVSQPLAEKVKAAPKAEEPQAEDKKEEEESDSKKKDEENPPEERLADEDLPF